MRCVERGLLLVLLGDVLLGVLDRARAGSRKRLVAGGLLLGEDKRRLRLARPAPGRRDLRFLRGDLGVAALDPAAPAATCASACSSGHIEIARVDAGDHVACVDVLLSVTGTATI